MRRPTAAVLAFMLVVSAWGGIALYLTNQSLVSTGDWDCAGAEDLGPVERGVCRLPVGDLRVDVPIQVSIDSAFEVLLTLSHRAGVRTDLADSLPVTDSTAVIDSLRVSERMGARLTGSAFSIDPGELRTQLVTRLSATQWNWQVSPREPGRHPLFVEVVAHISEAGRDAPPLVSHFRREVRVDEPLAHRAGRLFAWITSHLVGLSTAITALGAIWAATAIVRRRLRPRPPPQLPGRE
jgi:hypothetical protein